MKLSVYAKKQGISYTTAWRMWKTGKLDAYQLPTGTVIVRDEQPAQPNKVAVYARVSSTENKANLDSQAERLVGFCLARGWQVSQIVKEYGSGVNDQRPRFLTLLADPAITHIVVEHKDRASRFGVAYIQTLLNVQGRELVIANEAATDEDDLMGDFVAIITSFTARLYGRRRSKRKTNLVLERLKQDEAN